MRPTNLFSTLASVAALAIAAASPGFAGTAQTGDRQDTAGHGRMQVTKSPGCGCCGAWVALARKDGYDIDVTDTADVTRVKQDANIPGDLWACHTATIGGYVIEGHVPFDAVAKLLERRPDITGISVPGMPGGSPGMGYDPSARYDVIAFGGAAADGAVFHQAGR